MFRQQKSLSFNPQRITVFTDIMEGFLNPFVPDEEAENLPVMLTRKSESFLARYKVTLELLHVGQTVQAINQKVGIHGVPTKNT